MEQKVINEYDYKEYLARVPKNKIEELWANMIVKLPNQELRKEAESRGCELLAHPFIKEDGISKSFVLAVPEASMELIDELNKQHIIITLIKD